jgi:hypothetical protein
MNQVRCKNKRFDSEAQQRRCNRFLVCLPDWVIQGLKERENDPEGKIIARCPSCKVNKFAEIKFKNGKSVFESVRMENLEVMPSLIFDEMIITEEIGSEALSGKVK